MDGKVVLITGGGTGIGAACARSFARAGAHVAVVGRRRELIEQVAEDTGGLAVAANAADTSEMQRAVEEVLGEFGELDVLIANAGGVGVGAALDTDDAEWGRARSANLDTAFVAARQSLPSLIRKRGNIVFVSSIAGLAAGPEVCSYTTFKHALIGLTRSLARDYGPQGVRANVVCPGWVRTPMADQEMQVLMHDRGLTLDQAYSLVTRDVPLRRASDPEEIAAVCQFLASEAASIVTGAIIVADGGSTVVDVPTLIFGRE